MYYYCLYMFVWFSTNTYVGESRSVETMHHTVERFALTVVTKEKKIIYSLLLQRLQSKFFHRD
jgi:hypothetical protein